MLKRWARLCAALILTLSLVATPAAATTATPTGIITGRIETTWYTNGGPARLGDPIGVEQKVTIAGRNVYDQNTTAGFKVFWSRYAGGRVWAEGTVPALSGVDRERDPLARYGLAKGKLWRTGKLCNSSVIADQLLAAYLNPGGLIVDLRTSGAVSGCKDPALGVARVNYPVPSGYASDYRRYVTSAEARRSFGRALSAIAGAPGPVLIHCTAGKDRTGWLVLIIMSILGADQGDIVAEHLRSGTSEANVMRGLDQVAVSYGGEVTNGMSWAGMDRYVRVGLGLSQSTVDQLRTKFGA